MAVKIIEPTKEKKASKIRVAVYVRVSTEHDDQEDSFENQVEHYKTSINADPRYELIEIYKDYGVSGYKENRPGFQQMLSDARAHKFDLIITKSITRFARNTDVFLKAVRELNELDIGVLFELQNINTLTQAGELLITVYAAFAQGESENYSNLSRLVYRRKYENGIPVQYLHRSFGYTVNEAGKFIPDENAKWVRKIYEMAADGYDLGMIVRYLDSQGVVTVQGKRFIHSTVANILKNEIYMGDFIMQKHYMDENRAEKRNHGERDAYYIKNDHEKIVSRALWEKANDNYKKRIKEKYLDVMEDREADSYKGLLYCAKCGKPLIRRKYGGNKSMWICYGAKLYHAQFCTGVHVPDDLIKNWRPQKKIYIYEEENEHGLRSYRKVSESTWRKSSCEKVFKRSVPELTKENYPFLGKVYCKYCGAKLTRSIKCNNQVYWICSTWKRKGRDVCKGLGGGIPDEYLQKLGDPGRNVYIGKEKINGKDSYGYSEEPDNKRNKDSN